MSPKLLKVVTRNTYQQHFYRSLFSQQNVNKASSAYHITNLNKRNEDRSSFSILSKRNCRTTLCYPSGSLYINFVKRNASNDVSTIGDIEKMSNTSAQYVPENATPTDEVTNVVANEIMNPLWKISDWKIVACAQNTLLKVHEVTGLPWWATIALTALTARTFITLPFAIISMSNLAKLTSLKVKLDEESKKLTKEMLYAIKYHGWPESLVKQEYTRKIRKKWKDLIVEHNCHPAKSYILMLVQLPVWLSFSVATRNLCRMLPQQDVAAHITFLELSVGGFGWVKDLTMFDPYIILPAAIGLINLTIIELYNMWKFAPKTKIDKFLLYFFRFTSGVIFVAATNLPAAVNVYWLTSCTFGLGQACLVVSPRLRRFLGMPLDKPEMQHPYRYLYSTLKSRLRLGAS